MTNTTLGRPDPRREALAAAIYRLNGQALYGRDLGEFDGDRMEAERWRWLQQADLVLAELAARPAPVSSVSPTSGCARRGGGRARA